MKRFTWCHLYAIRKTMRAGCSIFLLISLCTQLLFANALTGQTASGIKINVQLENRSLQDILAEMERKSGLSFVYNDKLVAEYTRLSVSAKEQPLSVVLDKVLKHTKLGYLQKDNLIIIVEKETPNPGSIQVTAPVQEITVQGKVTDGESSPLPGVSVKIKNGQTGTTTNVEGKYHITVSPNAILVFSYLGFQEVEMPVNGRTAVDIVMKASIASLSEAVVIGYGTQRRSDVTSAVATVKSENFVKGPVLDAGQLLQGKVAGLTIATPSGNPTDGSQILLRGNTTLYGANANPLVIIDGIPGDLKTVAPEDIESVDVLKDGSSAAIYGVRGSNGVIIITTKRARGTYTNSVDYSGYATTQVISKKLDMLTAQDYRDQIKAGTRLASWDAGGSTDWLKEATRTPFTQVHNLTIRGGNATTNYLASANYRALQGIFRKSDNNTFSGRIDVNHSMFNDKLKLNVGILNQTNNYTRNNNGDNSFNGWIYRQTVIRNPTEPVRNENGDFYEQTGNFDYENPMALLYESDGEAKNVNSRMNATLTYRPIDNLKLSALFSYARFNSNKGYAESKKHISNIKSGVNGFASVASDLSIDRLTEWTAEYSRSFNQHHFTLLGGYGYQENESSGAYSDNQDFPTDVFGYNNIGLGEGIKNQLANISSYKTETNLVSFFTRLNYNYKDRYLLLASLRREGASQLY
ncbi:SusC/RagA family TonB-linked outer membrane protein, partial [Chitinophaga sp.]|uniref:SusC/RagA family TonB-linked outer membrane protein n=1 Tax=Chitinophaga sp. TaxID=1869181 RepID=UPI002CAF9DD5